MAGKVKCPNCGELDTVALHSDDDMYEWDKETHSYMPVDDIPYQNEIVCPKCNASVDAEFTGDSISAEEESD